MNLPPDKVVLALQYWAGDEARAMRLARLIADIEPRRREDVIFAFCRPFDQPETKLSWETLLHVGRKFSVIRVQSKREETGYPDGSFGLWAGTMEQLSELWASGDLRAHSVFTFEADGVPLQRDWIQRLLAEHDKTLEAGRRITGPDMVNIPHLNGSMICHLSLWPDRPSLHRTPPGQGWDLFHAAVIRSEGRGSRRMQNVYGAGKWSPDSLRAMAPEVSWLASQKDDSALEWAEAALVTAEVSALRGRVRGPAGDGSRNRRTYLTACRQHQVPVVARSMLDHCDPFNLYVVAWDWDPGPDWGTSDSQIKYITRAQFLARHPDYESLPGPPRPTINILDAVRWRVAADLLKGGEASVTYVDGDQWFFSSPESVFEEIGAARLAVSPHRIPPAALGLPGATLETHRQYGLYNSGFWCVADATIAEEMAESCRGWCYSDTVAQEDGTWLFGDQGFLEQTAKRHDAHVIGHPGLNVAPWNVNRYRTESRDGEVYVDDVPLITYHFSSLVLGKRLAGPGYAITAEQERIIYAPYVAALGGRSR